MLHSMILFAMSLLIIRRSPKTSWTASKNYFPQMIPHWECLSTQEIPCSIGEKRGIPFRRSYLRGVSSSNMVPRVNPCLHTTLRNLSLEATQLLEVSLWQYQGTGDWTEYGKSVQSSMPRNWNSFLEPSPFHRWKMSFRIRCKTFGSTLWMNLILEVCFHLRRPATFNAYQGMTHG